MDYEEDFDDDEQSEEIQTGPGSPAKSPGKSSMTSIKSSDSEDDAGEMYRNFLKNKNKKAISSPGTEAEKEKAAQQQRQQEEAAAQAEFDRKWKAKEDEKARKLQRTSSAGRLQGLLRGKASRQEVGQRNSGTVAPHDDVEEDAEEVSSSATASVLAANAVAGVFQLPELPQSGRQQLAKTLIGMGRAGHISIRAFQSVTAKFAEMEEADVLADVLMACNSDLLILETLARHGVAPVQRILKRFVASRVNTIAGLDRGLNDAVLDAALAKVLSHLKPAKLKPHIKLMEKVTEASPVYFFVTKLIKKCRSQESPDSATPA